MDLDAIKESIVKNVYHITAGKKEVPMHGHPKHDEIFYCIKGSGFGVLEDKEVKLNVGDAFIVHAGEKHSLKSNGDLYVSAILIPVIE